MQPTLKYVMREWTLIPLRTILRLETQFHVLLERQQYLVLCVRTLDSDISKQTRVSTCGLLSWMSKGAFSPIVGVMLAAWHDLESNTD